jgi:signal transduction histidine kinase
MVKLLARILAYNWKYYAAAVAVFVVFWQIFSVFSAVWVADDKLRTAMRQNAAYFEKAFLEGDVFETRRIMWRIKNDNMKRITFHPVEFDGSRWIFKEAIVGNLYDRPRAQLNRNVPVISNGAELGKLEYVLDLVDVNAAVFSENYVLFITVVFFFMGLLFLSNVGAIKTIFSIERCVTETNVLVDAGEHAKIRDAIRHTIQTLPESLRNTPFAVLIGRLAEVLQKASRLESDLAVSKAVSDLSAQVAHDIRSPLAALESASAGFKLTDEQQMLVKGAISRIQGIANDLLSKYRQGSVGSTDPVSGALQSAAAETVNLARIIEPIISEKRLQYRSRPDISINFAPVAEAGDINALCQPKEFQRIISNLVNNAAEAMEKGAITVSLAVDSKNAIVKVSDTGKGIPPEILAKLGRKGETHGKAGGTGLGLYHARTSAEAWGGGLAIESELGRGTTVTITLPRADTAGMNRMAVLIDDDALVHMTWKVAARTKGIALKAFKSPDDFLANLETFPKDTPIYIDSDLGSGIKGEDIAKTIHAKGFATIYLETGHSPGSFQKMPWIKEVISKDPPWAA